MSESTQVTPEIEAVAPVSSESPENILYKEVEVKAEATPEVTKPVEEPIKADEPVAPVEPPPVEEAAAPVAAVEIKLEVSKESGLTSKDAEEITALAKEAGLSQDVAQKLLDSRASHLKSIIDTQKNDMAVKSKAWLEDVKSDPEIGGEKFSSSILQANMFLDKFAPPGLRKILDDTGLGNYKDLVLTFARAGKLFNSNDTMVNGSKSAVVPARSIEDIMYPDKA